VKSLVDNDRQFELDALGCSEPVKTGESICNMLRETKTDDRLSSRVEYRLETVKRAGREGSQCRVTVIYAAIIRSSHADWIS